MPSPASLQSAQAFGWPDRSPIWTLRWKPTGSPTLIDSDELYGKTIETCMEEKVYGAEANTPP